MSSLSFVGSPSFRPHRSNHHNNGNGNGNGNGDGNGQEGTDNGFPSSPSSLNFPSTTTTTVSSGSPGPSTPKRSRRSSAASSVNNPRLSIIQEDSTSPPATGVAAPAVRKPSGAPTSPKSPKSPKSARSIRYPPPAASAGTAGQSTIPEAPEEKPAGRTSNRPFHLRFLGEPPRYSNDKGPPKYTMLESPGQGGEKLAELRNKKFFANRGGWKRICLIGLILLLIVIGLAVGLGVGLTVGRRKHVSSAPAVMNLTSPNNTSSGSDITGPFPAGSYTFTTFLINTSTACVSDASSWNCLPGDTYSQSQSASVAIFQWVINETSPNSNIFTIASTSNPFAVIFNPTPLTLQDQGTDNERYIFQATDVQKSTYPVPNVKCFFNHTDFSASLYTRKSSTLSTGGSSSSASAASPTTSTSTSKSSGSSNSNSNAYAPWPHAVDALQSIGGGNSVPECFQWNNGVLGDMVTQGYTPEPAASMCGCQYMNYGSGK